VPKKKSVVRKAAPVGMSQGEALRNASFLLMGVGVGVLLTNPLLNPHPLRWGFVLAAIGLVSYLASRAE